MHPLWAFSTKPQPQGALLFPFLHTPISTQNKARETHAIHHGGTSEFNGYDGTALMLSQMSTSERPPASSAPLSALSSVYLGFTTGTHVKEGEDLSTST